MKLLVCFCVAFAVVALAHESVVMDEATDLIQESALATAGAKTGAKVAESPPHTVSHLDRGLLGGHSAQVDAPRAT